MLKRQIHVVLGVKAQLLDLFLGEGADNLSRDPRRQRARWHRPGDHRSSSHHAARPDGDPVQDNGPNPDQTSPLDVGTVDDRSMAYGHFLANQGRLSGIPVQNGSILDIAEVGQCL